jgi:hypothetical protein
MLLSPSRPTGMWWCDTYRLGSILSIWNKIAQNAPNPIYISNFSRRWHPGFPPLGALQRFIPRYGLKSHLMYRPTSNEYWTRIISHTFLLSIHNRLFYVLHILECHCSAANCNLCRLLNGTKLLSLKPVVRTRRSYQWVGYIKKKKSFPGLTMYSHEVLMSLQTRANFLSDTFYDVSYSVNDQRFQHDLIPSLWSGTFFFKRVHNDDRMKLMYVFLL